MLKNDGNDKVITAQRLESGWKIGKYSNNNSTQVRKQSKLKLKMMMKKIEKKKNNFKQFQFSIHSSQFSQLKR